MKCKYVLLNANLIRDILNFKYENITIHKIRHNRWLVNSGDIVIGCFDRKRIKFLKELLWHRSFISKQPKKGREQTMDLFSFLIKKENKDE